MKTVYSSTDTRGLSSRDRRRVSLSARGAARARSGGKRGNLSALESRLHAALPAKDQRRPQAGRAREGRELPPAPAPCSHEGRLSLWPVALRSFGRSGGAGAARSCPGRSPPLLGVLAESAAQPSRCVLCCFSSYSDFFAKPYVVWNVAHRHGLGSPPPPLTCLAPRCPQAGAAVTRKAAVWGEGRTQGADGALALL